MGEGRNVKKLLKEHGPEKTFEIARQAARDYVYDLRSRGKISFSEPTEGEPPSVHVVRRTLPEVWEDMLMTIVGIGNLEHTHYDPGYKDKNFKIFYGLNRLVMGSLRSRPNARGVIFTPGGA